MATPLFEDLEHLEISRINSSLFFHSSGVRGITSLPDLMNFCNTKININREECDKSPTSGAKNKNKWQNVGSH